MEFLLLVVIVTMFYFVAKLEADEKNKEKQYFNNLLENGTQLSLTLNSHPEEVTKFLKESSHLRNYDVTKQFNGVKEGTPFSLYMLRKAGVSVSLLIVDALDYKPHFSKISIRRASALDPGKDHDTEWNDFNLFFDNEFKDPSQALEIVTPDFMSALVALKQKYGGIEFEYFGHAGYQKNFIALFVSEAIFSPETSTIEVDLKKLNELVTEITTIRNEL